MPNRLPAVPFDGQIYIDANGIKWQWQSLYKVWREVGPADLIPLADIDTIGLLSASDKAFIDTIGESAGGFGFIVAPQLILKTADNPDGVISGPITLHSESFDIKLVNADGVELTGTLTSLPDPTDDSYPILQFSLSQKLLDSLCLEIQGPKGQQGLKGPTGEPGENGYNDGPPGEPGLPGDDATISHKFSGIKIVDSDEISGKAVVSIDINNQAGQLNYTVADMSVPNSDEPADRLIATPVQRVLYYPLVPDQPEQYVTLDDWMVSIPSGDPLPDEPELAILKMPSGIQRGDTVPVESVKLTDVIRNIVSYYKEQLEKFQEEWYRTAKEFIESKDAAARQVLGGLAMELAECEWSRPIQFCLGIEPQDCINGPGGPTGSEPSEPASGDEQYVPPYTEPPPVVDDPTTPPDTGGQPPVPPLPPPPPEVPGQPLPGGPVSCAEPHKLLVVMIVDESYDCYVLNRCTVQYEDPDAPTTTIVYDQDKAKWETHINNLKSGQKVVLGILQPKNDNPSLNNDLSDLVYPGRTLPKDSFNSTIHHQILSTSNVTTNDIVNFVVSIVGESTEQLECQAPDFIPDAIVIQYHKKLSPLSTTDRTALNNAVATLKGLYKGSCVFGVDGWGDGDLYYQPEPTDTVRWLWSAMAVSNRYRCQFCNQGFDLLFMILLPTSQPSYTIDVYDRFPTIWDQDGVYWRDTITWMCGIGSTIRVATMNTNRNVVGTPLYAMYAYDTEGQFIKYRDGSIDGWTPPITGRKIKDLYDIATNNGKWVPDDIFIFSAEEDQYVEPAIELHNCQTIYDAVIEFNALIGRSTNFQCISL